jgi:hypothetical protein
MSPARLFAFMLLLALPLVGGPLDDLQSNFQTRCDFAEADRDLQLKKLDASYLAALDRQVEKTKATGKLDAVIPYINEIQAVKNAARAAGLAPPPSGESQAQDPARSDRPLPSDRNTETPGGNAATETPLPAGSSLELQQMRAKHAEARAKILKSHAEALASLADKMVAALKSRETEFTKAGKFDDALAAKKMRENMEKNDGILHAKSLIGTNAPDKSGMPGINWTSLASVPHEITKSGFFYVGLLDSKEGKGDRYKPFIEFLESKAPGKKREELIVMIPPAEIQFRTPEPVVEFKGKAILGFTGNVTFRVKAGGKVVAEKGIKEGEASPVVISCKFPATKDITLEVDDNGDVTGDCAAWLEADVR